MKTVSVIVVSLQYQTIQVKNGRLDDR